MLNAISCLIIDDDHMAAIILEKFIGRFAELSLIGKYSDPLKALEVIKNQNPQLIFLDIEMPEMSGLEMLDLLRSKRPHVILTTSSALYAVKSYEYEVIDYLLKPISFDRFVSSVEKLLKRMNLMEANEKIPDTPQSFFIKEDKINHKINFMDVQFVESMKDYLKIYLKDYPKKFRVVRQTMTEVENTWPNQLFIRCHRSYFVNINDIKSIDGTEIHLNSGISIPIGNTYKDIVKLKISEMRFGK